MPDLALRPARRSDEELLLAVYASTRADELAAVPWSEAEKAAFVRMQFEAQDRWWRQQTPAARVDVVLVDGEPAGRLYVDRRPEEIRIVDIALLPAHRGHGIGTRLLRALIEESEETGKALTLHVEALNPARALYERLGFSVVGDRGVHLFLERRGAQLKTAS